MGPDADLAVFVLIDQAVGFVGFAQHTALSRAHRDLQAGLRLGIQAPLDALVARMGKAAASKPIKQRVTIGDVAYMAAGSAHVVYQS